MKIKNEILSALGGTTAMLTKLTMEEERKFSNSPLNNILSFKFKDFRECKCSWCKNMRTNFCWNCEKPHCDKHARAIMACRMINTLCLNCAKEFEKFQQHKMNQE